MFVYFKLKIKKKIGQEAEGWGVEKKEREKGYSLFFSFGFMASVCNGGPEHWEEDEEEYHQVVIVGAGASGLAAADALHRSGISDVLILEGVHIELSSLLFFMPSIHLRIIACNK